MPRFRWGWQAIILPNLADNGSRVGVKCSPILRKRGIAVSRPNPYISNHHRGYVPTHGPDCAKKRSFPTTCQRCGQSIIYFECSCGSKVFLDPPDQGVHDCTQTEKAYRAQMLIDLIEISMQDARGSTVCPMCEAKVLNAKDRIRKHFKRCPKRSAWFSSE